MSMLAQFSEDRVELSAMGLFRVRIDMLPSVSTPRPLTIDVIGISLSLAHFQVFGTLLTYLIILLQSGLQAKN